MWNAPNSLHARESHPPQFVDIALPDLLQPLLGFGDEVGDCYGVIALPGVSPSQLLIRFEVCRNISEVVLLWSFFPDAALVEDGELTLDLAIFEWPHRWCGSASRRLGGSWLFAVLGSLAHSSRPIRESRSILPWRRE